jgi:DNA-binding NarL/FixJ family response regulator
MRPITLLIADSHPTFRESLRQLCEIAGGFVVLAEAATGQEAVKLARALAPEMVLLDRALADLPGIEVTQQIVAASPGTQVLLLSLLGAEGHAEEARRSGARDCLPKDCDPATLLAAIQAAFLRPPAAD